MTEPTQRHYRHQFFEEHVSRCHPDKTAPGRRSLAQRKKPQLKAEQGTAYSINYHWHVARPARQRRQQRIIDPRAALKAGSAIWSSAAHQSGAISGCLEAIFALRFFDEAGGCSSGCFCATTANHQNKKNPVSKN